LYRTGGGVPTVKRKISKRQLKGWRKEMKYAKKWKLWIAMTFLTLGLVGCGKTVSDFCLNTKELGASTEEVARYLFENDIDLVVDIEVQNRIRDEQC
jgi:hypothetical protein